ncbi:MAG TPA: FecR domain-containing protein [Anaeromyxobacter sp.]|nr:FecR domain-containing protein [Anaeromyxobacter sp.]
MGGARERAVFWSIAALLVGGAALAYRVLLGPAPAATRPPPQAAAAAAAAPLIVVATSGEVTIVRAGARSRAAKGDVLRADDAIETAPGGRVELDGGGYEVFLDEDASFDVREITAELSRFRLVQGVVSARVRDDHAVEIEGVEGSRVRTRGGDVAVARSGDTVAVGVERGSAEFAAAGGTVVLASGQQSVAAPGRRPSPPAPIPASLLLKVSWPDERTTNRRKMVVTGRTQPGAIVVLGDERVEVQPDGRFTHVIALREGRQRLSARARGVGGSASADGPVILLDTRAPDARFDTRELWRKAEK